MEHRDSRRACRDCLLPRGLPWGIAAALLLAGCEPISMTRLGIGPA